MLLGCVVVGFLVFISYFLFLIFILFFGEFDKCKLNCMVLSGFVKVVLLFFYFFVYFIFVLFLVRVKIVGGDLIWVWLGLNVFFFFVNFWWVKLILMIELLGLKEICLGEGVVLFVILFKDMIYGWLFFFCLVGEVILFWVVLCLEMVLRVWLGREVRGL